MSADICLFLSLFIVVWAIFQLSGDCHHYRRAANLDLCLAFSSEGSLTCHTYCDTGPRFIRTHPKDPWFSLRNAKLLAKEQSLPIYFNVLGLTRPGVELTTFWSRGESSTTEPPRPVTADTHFMLGTLLCHTKLQIKLKFGFGPLIFH